MRVTPPRRYRHRMAIPPDRYDELRRQWIHDHWAWSEIQRARMEKLDIQIRRRTAATVLAAPSRRDDLPRNPLPARGHSSTIGALEFVGFCTLLTFLPIGWPLGRGLYRLLTQLVPDTLRSYPTSAALCTACTGWWIPLLYDPGPGIVDKIVVPWAAGQLAGTMLIAGLYGIVEGWLAVPGAGQLWPSTLPALEMNETDAAEVLGADVLTSPSVIEPSPPVNLGRMTPPLRNEDRGSRAR